MSEKGNNSAKYLKNLPKINQVIYHDLSSSGSPDILLTRSFMG